MLTRQRLAGDLAVELRKMITVDLKPGDRLESEKDLGERFGVSRNTVREALLTLWDEGLVVRRWGVGTFVRDSDQPLTQSMSTVVPMDDLIRGSGDEVTLVDASIELVWCPDDAAAALGLEVHAQVWEIVRTFAFDKRPAFVLMDWVPPVVNGRTIDPSPLKQLEVGLLTLLRDTARCKITRMEANFTAIAATEAEAVHLDIPVGTPLIAAEQVSIDNVGDIAIFSRNLYQTAVSSLHLVRSTRIS